MSARRLVMLASIGALGVAAFALARQSQAAGQSSSGPFDLVDNAGDASSWFAASGDDEAPAGVADALTSAADTIVGGVDDFVYQTVGLRIFSESRWAVAAGQPDNVELVQAMHAAEQRYGMPWNLVVRVAWQESRFRTDAFNKRSGATGIMQIVPRFHPGVDPTDPLAAIDYGARYLSQLYRQFGTWELALKAYNWGPGNVQKWLASGRVAPPEPLETRNYSSQILADVNAAGQVVS